MRIKMQRRTGIRPLIVRTVLRNVRLFSIIVVFIAGSFVCYVHSNLSKAHTNGLIQQHINNIQSGLKAAKTLTIVAIGCSRANGLLATLNSAKAMREIPNNVYLHICIDGCPNNEDVQRVAESFEWPFGEKIVTVRPESYGLARHISQCWTDPKANEWSLFLEDDVLLAPNAMIAFDEALQIRQNHNQRDKIIGIALHDSRANQYCWKERIHNKRCPEIQKLCQTGSPTWTQSGGAMCHGKYSSRSWNLNQFPSSWGAWYEGSAWSLYQRYYESRSNLSVSESLMFSVPHSYSTEWDHSWKRFLLELMFRAGWTVMYRVHPNQDGFATTLRSPGVHTTNEKSPMEAAKTCLQSMPLDQSKEFVRDTKLNRNANAMQSFDYCIAETSIDDLRRQGKISVSVLAEFPAVATSSALGNAVSILQLAAGTDTQHYADDNSWWNLFRTCNAKKMSSGYEVDFLNQTEVLLVTSMASGEKNFARTAASFSWFGGKVHFLIAAPKEVCKKFGRGNIYATCAEEVHFKNEGGNKLPSIPKLLRAARAFAGPNVKWIGLMNGDITFERRLPKVLSSVGTSEPCLGHPCALVGQRYDIDWTSRKERLHSEWGMDYFIFNLDGMNFVLDHELIPPLTIGLVRWDSWLMATLALHESIGVIDISEGVRVDHYMDFKETYKSKTNVDRWNLNLVDARFHFGRTDHANYRLRRSGKIELKHDAGDLQTMYDTNKERYERNMLMEKASNFTYTTGPLPNAHFRCLCDILKMAVPGSLTEKVCAPIEASAIKRQERPIFFFKSMLELIALSESIAKLDERLQELSTDRSKSKCCVLLDKFDHPVRVPDIFWSFEVLGSPNVRCLFPPQRRV